MKNDKRTAVNAVFFRMVIGLLLTFTVFTNAIAQTTGADTIISNQASASYSDGNGNNFSSVSNTVTITVAKVSGLAITPDGVTNSSVVPGQTSVNFTFRVTNTGNFTDQVRFLANGSSIRLIGPGTITAAVISGSPSTNILTNSADVLQSLAQNGFVDVVVTANVNGTATPGSTIQVFLGDATTGTNFDNVAVGTSISANEVRTVSTASVNGLREARGDISVTVDNDGLLRSVLTVPAGPVALASNIIYGVQACNDGQRAITPIVGAPLLPPVTGLPQIMIVVPIPAGTTLTTGQTYPVGTEFSVTALTTLPGAAVWTTTAPATLANVRRIRIPAGSSLPSATCSTAATFQLTITTNNTNTPIYGIAETFGRNSLLATLSDQSGDAITNKGDGNADFNEPLFGQAATSNQGFQLPTLLLQIGNVLIGPNLFANAVGPTNTNDDYTNRSVTTGIAGVAPLGVTTATGTVVYTNTIQNTGNVNDTYTLTSPTVPTGFTVEISVDNGTTYTTVSNALTPSTTVSIPFGSSANILVRITAPAGKTVLTGYATTIRAVSGVTNTNNNATINRLYTGFIRMVKSFAINNATGVGAVTDAVPGAQITYTITYDNVSSSGGTNNATLTASNLVITEDGLVAPNNWGTYTDHVVGATDSLSGTITGDALLSTSLTDTITTLAPGASGVFTFKRVIK
jgi:hypothetical protein